MPDSAITAPADFDVVSIVAGLRQSRDVLHNVRYRGPVRPPPSREEIVETLAQLTMALFPAHYGRLGGKLGSAEFCRLQFGCPARYPEARAEEAQRQKEPWQKAS